MKLRLLFVTSLSLGLLFQPPALGAENPAAMISSPSEAKVLPGVELARTLATATGIAITPLLGLSVVGAWEAYKATPEARAELPWYASRWFWIPGLTIALLLVLKDPLLGLIPGAKKPLDVLDVLENKASAVLATPAVVPMFLSTFAGAQAVQALSRTPVYSLGEAGVAALGLAGGVGRVLLLTVAAVVFLAAFFCVWMAFHAINVLILLSPFGPLDFLLRSVKFGVLVVLAISTFIHPYLGVLVALMIVVVSIPIAGWSFRLAVFGSVLAGDLIAFRHRREVPDRQRLRAFVAKRVGGARPRSYGRVSISGEGISFSYRPWLVLGRRKVELPAGSYRLGRGLICPLLCLQADDGAPISILRLPPRYRFHDAALVEMLSLAGVDEMPLRRGLKAAVEWLKDIAGRGGEGAARLTARVREGLGS